MLQYNEPQFIVISRSANLALGTNSSSERSIDFQTQVRAYWSDLVKADGSGVLENYTRHGWGCGCCSDDPEYLKAKRKYYKRKTNRPYNFKNKEDV